MLRVTNGAITLTVTKGAFYSFYKPTGFHIVDGVGDSEGPGRVITHPASETAHPGDSSHKESADYDEEEEEEEEPEEDVDLSEIPLSEMSFKQLSDYADELELDHDGIRSKKELRTLIREHLNK